MDTGGTRDIIEPGVTGLLSLVADELAADVSACVPTDAAPRARRSGKAQGRDANSTRPRSSSGSSDS
jgi:hypothetical protein